MSAATAQIPLADNTLIVPAQMTMVISLGKVFGYKITEGIAKSLVVPLVVQGLGREVAKTLVGILPVAGNVVKAGVSVFFTEALGWIVANEFDEGSKKNLDAEEVFRTVEKSIKFAKE